MGVVITKVPDNFVNDYAARREISDYYVALKSYHLHVTVLSALPVKERGPFNNPARSISDNAAGNTPSRPGSAAQAGSGEDSRCCSFPA